MLQHEINETENFPEDFGNPRKSPAAIIYDLRCRASFRMDLKRTLSNNWDSSCLQGRALFRKQETKYLVNDPVYERTTERPTERPNVMKFASCDGPMIQTGLQEIYIVRSFLVPAVQPQRPQQQKYRHQPALKWGRPANGPPCSPPASRSARSGNGNGTS